MADDRDKSVTDWPSRSLKNSLPLFQSPSGSRFPACQAEESKVFSGSITSSMVSIIIHI